MIKRNVSNEQIKRLYADYLQGADGKAETTIRQIERAISRYETFTDCVDFNTFNQRWAKDFKDHLRQENLSKATILSTVTALKRFFGWFVLQQDLKAKFSKTDIEFLNMPDGDVRAAKANADRAIPTLEQVLHVVDQMPDQTSIENRNRALVAFTAITGIRDGALVSLKLKHFDRAKLLVRQIPTEVSTKRRKRIDTFLFPLDEHLRDIFLGWVDFLQTVELFAQNDPLFPSTKMGQDADDCFEAVGLKREHWADASPVRAIFRAAFASAGLPNYTPHSFRHMIVSEAYRRNLSPRELIAWSQNLGHESLLTTITSYGKLPTEEQGRLIREAEARGPESEVLEKIRKLIA